MTEIKKMAGRPRDPDVASRVKEAALRLMRLQGYASVSIAEIARDAGVAKQTVYNRWPGKADLVLEAIFEETGRHAAVPPDEPHQSCAVQLEAFLCQIFEHLRTDAGLIRALISAAQDDDAFRQAFSERFVDPRENMVIEILRRAQSRGELPVERDIFMLSSFIHGAFWYALLNGRDLDPNLAGGIAAEIFTTLRP